MTLINALKQVESLQDVFYYVRLVRDIFVALWQVRGGIALYLLWLLAIILATWLSSTMFLPHGITYATI